MLAVGNCKFLRRQKMRQQAINDFYEIGDCTSSAADGSTDINHNEHTNVEAGGSAMVMINDTYEDNDQDNEISRMEKVSQRIMFEDQPEDVDEHYFAHVLDKYNPHLKNSDNIVNEPQIGENGVQTRNDEGSYESRVEKDEYGVPHVSISLQKTPSPSQYKKRIVFGATAEGGQINSTKNPYYSGGKKTPQSALKQQSSEENIKFRSILKGQEGGLTPEEEGQRNPSSIPQPSNVPLSKKSPSPRVKFEGASVNLVEPSMQDHTITLEEFQKRYIERASSPPPFSVIAEEKLAKMQDVEKLISSIVENSLAKNVEELKAHFEYLNNGVYQMLETQFNTMLNLRTNASISFEDSPEYKDMAEKLDFLNAENEHLKLLLEERDLEIQSLREQAELMRERYIMDIDKLTSEVANSRIAPKPLEEEKMEEHVDENPRTSSPPRSRSPPPQPVQQSYPKQEARRSLDFNAAVRNALHNMSKEQANPLSKSFDAKQFKINSEKPKAVASNEEQEQEENQQEDKTRKANKTLDSITERMLRSLKGPIRAEDNSKQIDKMVNDIKEQFKEKGVILPLKRVKDCVYAFGEGKAERKVHLNIVNGVLKVKIGGGYDDFLKFLSQSVRLLQAKKK